MPNIVDVTYDQTDESKKTNSMGIRGIQERTYSARNAQYFLLKASPAFGKFRMLIFIALDELINQGLKKVIVAVSERSIGGSLGTTNLKSNDFFG